MKNILVTLTIFASLTTINSVPSNITSGENSLVITIDEDVERLGDRKSDEWL